MSSLNIKIFDAYYGIPLSLILSYFDTVPLHFFFISNYNLITHPSFILFILTSVLFLLSLKLKFHTSTVSHCFETVFSHYNIKLIFQNKIYKTQINETENFELGLASKPKQNFKIQVGFEFFNSHHDRNRKHSY